MGIRLPLRGLSASRHHDTRPLLGQSRFGLDGGGQMLLTFRPQTPATHVALFHQIYGTRAVRQESFYEYRIQLPQGMNPNRALRIFMLYPNVINVQRLYS